MSDIVTKEVSITLHYITLHFFIETTRLRRHETVAVGCERRRGPSNAIMHLVMFRLKGWTSIYVCLVLAAHNQELITDENN